MAIRTRVRIWSVRWLALGTVFALGACSPAARQDPGSGKLAFSACADSPSWASAPVSDERRSRLDVSCATQIAGFEDAFNTYADQCSLRDMCAMVGDARALFDRTVRSARDAPIRRGRSVGDPPASWDVVLRAVFGFLASPETWPYLDAALPEAARGDSGSLYDMIDSFEGKTPCHADLDIDDAAFVIGCNDSASGPPAEQLRTEAAQLAQMYSRFGEYGAWWLFSCTYWTTPHPVLPIPESTAAAPVLVVGTKGDPATPYSGAVALVRAIGPSATLLTASGGGHTAFGRWPCVGDHVTRYLIEVRVPEGQAC